MPTATNREWQGGFAQDVDDLSRSRHVPQRVGDGGRVCSGDRLGGAHDVRAFLHVGTCWTRCRGTHLWADNLSWRRADRAAVPNTVTG